MSSDPTKPGADGTGARRAPEADLPQAPPGAPEGHDADTPGKRDDAPAAADAAGAAPDAGRAAPGAGTSGDGHDPAAGGSPPAAAGGDGAAGPGDDSGPLVTSLGEAELSALAAKAEKAEQYLALAQRTQADFENYRKRSVRDAAAAQERGALKLALALLPAIDNLDRALAHADAAVAGEDANGAASLVAGIKHVHADVIAALGNVGIERYSPEGERFDPQFHEAVAQQPVEGTEPGVVVEVFQRGYRMGENVVRPARVVVAG